MSLDSDRNRSRDTAGIMYQKSPPGGPICNKKAGYF